MVLFPPCKINLGLRILYKREDGYHALETAFYPVPLRDALEAITLPTDHQTPTLEVSGISIAGNPADNLCMKAWHLIKTDHPTLPAVSIHLLKKIPTGAGLGGGSSDGAFMLRLLNEKFLLNISTEKLMEYALQLGSDCPFFLLNQPAIATGRGEILEPITLDLSGYSMVLVHPGVHINTGWAFSQIKPQQPEVPLKTILQQPVSAWKDTLINDFESSVCQHHPELLLIREKLYAAGALYSAMSGSGSTFYGIFPKNEKPSIEWPDHYQVYYNVLNR